MEQKPEFPREVCPSGSGNGMSGYSVEARHNFPDPIVVGEQIFDNRWREIKFVEGHAGVPNGRKSIYSPAAYGLLEFASAQALRWWFHAEANNGMSGYGGGCIETRIVEHEIEYSYKVRAIAAHEYAGGDGGSISTRHPMQDKGPKK